MTKVKAYLLPLLFTLAFGTVGTLYASGLAGTCGDVGQPACTIGSLGFVFKSAITFLLKVSSLVMILAIVWVGWGYITAQDKAQQLQEAKRRLRNLVLGLLLLTLVGSAAFVGVFKYIGVNENVLNTIRTLLQGTPSASSSFLPSILPFPHAYAADSTLLANPLGVSNLYDFLVLILKLFIRWFIFPMVVAGWLFTGYKYVAAQGAPEKLLDAHKWLWYTFIGTVIIMLAAGFASALSGTINQVLKS